MQSKNWKCVQDVNTINKVLREVRFRAVKRVLVVRFCGCCFFVRRRLVGRHVDTNADDEKSCNKSHCNETKRVVFNRVDYLKKIILIPQTVFLKIYHLEEYCKKAHLIPIFPRNYHS